MAKAMYDPWSKIVTKNGYAGDEVISALQKSIRRAKEEDACMFAYEMYISSPQLLRSEEHTSDSSQTCALPTTTCTGPCCSTCLFTCLHYLWPTPYPTMHWKNIRWI